MQAIQSQQIIDRLKMAGVKPSSQRIQIMRYVMEHKTHPTVDQIYQDLLPDNPTLSRTTVYNTLWLLADSGAINVLNIDRTNAHFDYVEMPHAHFRCKHCGNIYDLPFDYAAIPNPENLKIDSVDLYFEGTCNDCINKTNE